MNKFLNFNELITPTFINLLYWCGIVLIVIGSIVSITSSLSMMRFAAAASLGGIVLTTIGAAAGIVLWRIWCEMIIVFFKIYEKLDVIDSNTKKV